MKKLLVYLDEDFHADLKELAHQKKVSMGALVRFAVDKTFEDELDGIAAQRGFEEHLRDPSGTISLDDFLKEQGLVLPQRAGKKGAAEPTPDPSRRRRQASAGGAGARG